MKILIVGNWRWPQYEAAFARGLHENNADAAAFSSLKFFAGRLGRLQQAVPLLGPAMLRLNRAVIAAVQAQSPDMVLFWRPTHMMPLTIKRIKAMGALTVSYNNDDPFGPKVPGDVPLLYHFLWWWYLSCLPHFDMNFFYRKINCVEARGHGARHAEILLPYFMPWQDRPQELTTAERQRYATDVVFVGHYEPDGRVESIHALVKAGLTVKLWGANAGPDERESGTAARLKVGLWAKLQGGQYWSREILGDLYDTLAPIVPAEGDNYAKALCGAKICLAFLSKLNRDTYTRRCFEIPACGRVMLAERTDDLMHFFREDEEACFFSSSAELVEKARWLIANAHEAERIGAAGMQRVWADRHDVKSRAREFLDMVGAKL